MRWYGLGMLAAITGFVLLAGQAVADDGQLCVSDDADVAITACTKLLSNKNEKNSGRAAFFVNRGRAYSLKQDRDRAISDFNQAIELLPDFAVAFFDRGAVYGQNGNQDSAIADFDKAIELKPDYALAYRGRCDSYKAIKNYDHAIADCSKALDLDPKFAEALKLRGIVYLNMRNYDLAIADLSKFIDRKSDDATAFLNRSAAYSGKKYLDSAIDDLYRATVLQPDSAIAFSGLCDSYKLKKNYDRAITACNKAIALDPGLVAAWNNRGSVYSEMGNYDLAITDYNKALELAPDTTESLYNRAQAYAASRDYDRAISDYTKEIMLNPLDVEALNYRGYAYWMKDDYDRAAGDFSKAIELMPDYALARSNLSSMQEVRAEESRIAAPSKASGTPEHAPKLPAVRRVALVIGNSSYQAVAQLPNPSKDADLVGTALRNAGVDDVTVVHDLDHGALIAALKTFADKADNSDWAIIYYAGHGIEVDGHNYLIPVDARLASDRDVADETVSLDRMMAAINGARQLKLVVLDACRNNPFHPKITVANRSIDRGLSRVEPDGATLVVYAAKEGTTAKDGDGDDSPFAISFARRISEPDVEINKVLRFVRQDVLEATGRQQEPFVYGSLPPTDFFFVTAK